MFWSKQVSKNNFVTCFVDYYTGKVTSIRDFVIKGDDLYCNGKLWAKKDPNYIEVLMVNSDTIFYKDKKGKVTIIKETKCGIKQDTG